MAVFNYDLGAGWKMQQIVDDKTDDNGALIEAMVFSKGIEQIVLENESVKKLRGIFKTINR